MRRRHATREQELVSEERVGKRVKSNVERKKEGKKTRFSLTFSLPLSLSLPLNVTFSFFSSPHLPTPPYPTPNHTNPLPFSPVVVPSPRAPTAGHKHPVPCVPPVHPVPVPRRALPRRPLVRRRVDPLRPARKQPRAVDDERRRARVGRVALQARVLAPGGREQVAEQVAVVAKGRSRQAGPVGGAAEVAVLGRLGHVAHGQVPRVLDARGHDDLGGAAAAARGAAA